MSRPTPSSSVESFVRIDQLGALAGVAFVIVANGAFLRNAAAWLAVPPILVLVGALALARRALPDDVHRALLLTAAGNWQVAVIVSALFPFLWPPMILAVLLPLVLATPFLDRGRLGIWIAAASVVTAIVGAIGLLNDDGGVIEDIDDTFEFVIVIGALGALTIPIALVIRQNNALQRHATEQLADSRRRVVEAADAERSRIERDLHDGAQQRLVAMRMRLQLASSEAGDERIREVLTALTDDVDAAVAELRELAHGIYPPELAANGLAEALASAVRRAPARFTSNVEPVGRLPEAVERALYFTALEAMSNAAKHTDGPVTVTLARANGQLDLDVSDAGPGFDVASAATSVGLSSMADRIDAVGGELTIRSEAAGTTVSVAVPRT